jgi:hypothetical protein
MVEMLMAAFILAIGILGLAVLQTFSLRGQTASVNQAVAVQVANRVLDQAEMLGRNSINCARAGIAPPAPPVNYFDPGIPVVLRFGNTGQQVPPAAAPVVFTATSSAVTAAGPGAPGVVAPVPRLGGIALLTVVVTWAEAAKAGNSFLNRTVTLQRQVNYATS